MMLIYESTLSDEFFICRLKAQMLQDKSYLGKIRIYRKDTNEKIHGKNCFDASLAQVIDCLKLMANDFLDKSQKPENWEKVVPEKEILLNYLEIQNNISAFFYKGQDSIDEVKYYRNLAEMNKITQKTTLQLSSQIEKLKNSEKKKLISGSEEEYKNMDDPHVLEILNAKMVIFDYVLNPSKTLIALHEKHCKRMNNEIE